MPTGLIASLLACGLLYLDRGKTHSLGTGSRRPAHGQYRSINPQSACTLVRAQPRSPHVKSIPYINLVMLESQLQVVVDGFVGDLAQQCEI